MKKLSMEQAAKWQADTMGAVCGLCKYRENDPELLSDLCSGCEARERIGALLDAVYEASEPKEMSERLREAFKGFKDLRIKKKQPLTPRAEKMIWERLSKLTSDDETKAKILDQSVEMGWTGVFPLKNDGGWQMGTRGAARRGKAYEQHEINDSAVEGFFLDLETEILA